MRRFLAVLCLATSLDAAITTYLNTAVTNTVVNVKASSGTVHGYIIGEPGPLANGTCYLQVFNVSSGSVILGTTAPVISIPFTPPVGTLAAVPSSIPFSTAISIAATGSPTGNDACTTGPLLVNIFFE